VVGRDAFGWVGVDTVSAVAKGVHSFFVSAPHITGSREWPAKLGDAMEQIQRVERVWAANAAELVTNLGRLDGRGPSEVFELAGGVVAMGGAGSYVNAGFGLGIGSSSFTVNDAVVLEAAARRMGVGAAVQVSVASSPSVRAVLYHRGYQTTDIRNALWLEPNRTPLASPDRSFQIVLVDESTVQTWTDTTALGWGHLTVAARRRSDDFSRAAFMGEHEQLLLACDAQDDRPVGCASITIRDGVATLGAMCTLPAERNRGVQTALVRHRIAMAREENCDLVATLPAPRGGSERNLLRLGFSLAYDQHRLSLPAVSGRQSR